MGAVEPAPDGAALAMRVHGSSQTLLVLSGMMSYPSSFWRGVMFPLNGFLFCDIDSSDPLQAWF